MACCSDWAAGEDKKPLDPKGPAAKPAETVPPASKEKPAAAEAGKKEDAQKKPPSDKQVSPDKKEPAEKKEPTEKKESPEKKEAIEKKPSAEESAKPARAPIAAELVAGQSKFADRLLAQLAQRHQGNLAFSPFSVSQALSLISEGARGETLAEVEAALQGKLASPQRHAAIAGLNLELSRSAKDGNELAIANGLWAQPGKELLPEFLRVGRELYGAEVQKANFATQAEAERAKINVWVAKATRDKIPAILPTGSLDSTSRLVLVNAVYLKAGWETPFNPERTETEPFFVAPDKSVSVPMMHRGDSMLYAESEGGQMVALPYVGKELEMVLFLPKKGTAPETFLSERSLAELEKRFPLWEAKAIDPASPLAKYQAELIGRRKTTSVSLTLPRFEVESRADLQPVLKQLGVQRIFDRKQADLSGLDGKADLVLADLFHAARIEVDEKGTIAAAATAGGFKSRSGNIVSLRFDRPFAFVIRHVPSSAILFVGRVSDPGKSSTPATAKQ